MEKTIKTTSVQEIINALKQKKITYFQAEEQLQAFSQQGLIFWILKDFFEPPVFETKNPDLLSEHQKSLPKDNPYNNIRM